jgi:hypothetical protein
MLSFMQARSSGLIGLAGCTKGRQRGRTTAAERVDYGGQITGAVAAAAWSACVGGGRARLRSRYSTCTQWRGRWMDTPMIAVCTHACRVHARAVCANASRVHARTPCAFTHVVCTRARHVVVALKQRPMHHGDRARWMHGHAVCTQAVCTHARTPCERTHGVTLRVHAMCTHVRTPCERMYALCTHARTHAVSDRP